MKQRKKLITAALLSAVCLAWAQPGLAVSAAEQLRAADAKYEELLKHKDLRNDRAKWLELAEKYEGLRSKGPSAAAKADLKLGDLYEQLARFSGRKSDLREAVKAYQRLADENPKNAMADDALSRAARICDDKLNDKTNAIKLYRQVIALKPDGDQAGEARKALKSLGASEKEPKKDDKKDSKKDDKNKSAKSLKDAKKATDKADNAKDKASDAKAKKDDGDKLPSLDEAEKQYIELLKSPSLRKDRGNWLKLIATYDKIKQDNPAPALFKLGKLYEQLGGVSAQENDYREAVKNYRQLADNHPKSSLSDDALLRAGRIQELQLGDPDSARACYKRIIRDYPRGDMLPAARERLAILGRSAAPATSPKPEATIKVAAADSDSAAKVDQAVQAVADSARESSLRPGQVAKVKSVRGWNNGEYVRVTIELDSKVPFRTFVLPPNPAADKPYRLVMDLEHSGLTAASRAPQENIGMVTKVRCSQKAGSSSRIVFDLKEEPNYNAFRLENPNRIVVDIRTSAQAARTPTISAAKAPTIGPDVATIAPAPASSPAPKPSKPLRPGFGRVKSGQLSHMPTDVPSIARQLSLKVSRIVIDPGHGGKDPGAISNGLREADITLQIAERLAERLRREGYEVFLTRDTSETVALEERTAFANRKKADLFISLHLNANRDPKARGVETYFLNLTTDETAIQVAARENATSSRSLGELQGIINDLMLNSKINESSRFASELHKGVLGASRAVGYSGADRGVRQAPFYVLLGARMPSVLIELGFITNEKDAEMLQQANYQKTLIDGLWKGICAYINSTGYAFNGGGGDS